MLERTTQPMTDAVIERPQTLIEKLEQEVNRLLELKAQEKPHSLGYVFLGHHIAATVNAINIVKQHEAESEVQEKIYQQEMDKINFCGCSCILSDGLTQCSDCEALDD